MPTDYNSDENLIPAPKKRGPQSAAGQLRSLSNLRPPWKKGEVPNPSGRSKRTLTEALIKKLVARRANALAEALIKEAEAGNVFAWKEAADRTEGKVAERLEVSGTVDLGLRIAAARARRRLAADEAIEAKEPDLATLPPAEKPI